MIEVKRLIEWDFPIERMNKLAEKESSANFTRKPIYNMHKWWARRIGSIFRAITLLSFLRRIEDSSSLGVDLDDQAKFNDWFWGTVDKYDNLKIGLFYKPINLEKVLGYKPVVLDPFMGGGTTVIESLRLGCKVIGIDLSPVAWFITKMEVEPADLKKIEREFKRIEIQIGEKIKSYYKTRCPKCVENGEESKADVVYVFWVKKVNCVNCGKEVKLYKNFILAKPKKSKPTVFCPSCYTIFAASSLDIMVNCPNCNLRFVPSKGPVSKGKYTCQYCGQKYGVLDSVRRQLPSRKKSKDDIWYPEEAEIYAVEYFCSKHGRNYKMAEDCDKQLYEQAKKDFRVRINDLRRKNINIFGRYIHDQKIPKDKADPRPNNYGYEYFWQMFNERQLYCLSLLLEEILKIKDQRIKELMLMVVSSIAEYNNTFCEYNSSQRVIGHLFSHHGYVIKNAPVENNVWGAKGAKGKIVGTGSFIAFFKRTVEGIAFQRKTFERFVIDDGSVTIPLNDWIEGKLARDFKEFTSRDSNILLAKDAQDLSFIYSHDSLKVDAVITDPPYYDNVMYSELADFYYVWLRLGLKDHYEEFKPLYTPRTQEIVVNPKVGKREEDYVVSLTNVFRESSKVLKDDGLLVFTYHHASEETWAVILKAVLDAGFYIVATYPVHSEMTVSTHIREKEVREFDTIIVARKRLSTPELVIWENLKDEIYVEAKKAIERVLKTHPSLTNGDRSTIILGKCLEIYSKHYPNVQGIGGDVKKAIQGIGDIIRDLYLKTPTPRCDVVTEFYLEHLAKEGSMPYNELLKLMQSREVALSIDELKDIGILRARGSDLVVVDPLTRGQQLGENARSGRFNLKYYVDVVHLYYYLFTEGKKLPKLSEIGEFDLPTLSSILRYTANALKDDRYRKILDLLKASEAEPRGLEKFM